MSYYNNNDVPPPPHAGWDEEKWRRLIEEERRQDEKDHDRILNKILHLEGSYWCICGGRFNAECFGDAFLCLYDHEKDMFKIEEKIYTSDDDFTWSNLSEENRDEWKLKTLLNLRGMKSKKWIPCYLHQLYGIACLHENVMIGRINISNREMIGYQDH